MICSKCGRKVNPEKSSCSKCGEKIELEKYLYIKESEIKPVESVGGTPTVVSIDAPKKVNKAIIAIASFLVVVIVAGTTWLLLKDDDKDSGTQKVINQDAGQIPDEVVAADTNDVYYYMDVENLGLTPEEAINNAKKIFGLNTNDSYVLSQEEAGENRYIYIKKAVDDAGGETAEASEENFFVVFVNKENKANNISFGYTPSRKSADVDIVCNSKSEIRVFDFEGNECKGVEKKRKEGENDGEYTLSLSYENSASTQSYNVFFDDTLNVGNVNIYVDLNTGAEGKKQSQNIKYTAGIRVEVDVNGATQANDMKPFDIDEKVVSELMNKMKISEKDDKGKAEATVNISDEFLSNFYKISDGKAPESSKEIKFDNLKDIPATVTYNEENKIKKIEICFDAKKKESVAEEMKYIIESVGATANGFNITGVEGKHLRVTVTITAVN